MKFEEHDKPFIKGINSNIIRTDRAKELISKIEFLKEVANDAAVFSIILKNRGDYEHSTEYIDTALSANIEITIILTQFKDELEARKKE